MSTTVTTPPVRAAAEDIEPWPSLACLSIGFVAALFIISQHVRFSAAFGSSTLANVSAAGGTLLGLAIGASVARLLLGSRARNMVAYLHAAFAAVAVALPWALSGLAAVEELLLGNVAETPSLDWLQIVVQLVAGVLVFAPAGVLVASTLIVAIAARPRDPRGHGDAAAASGLGLAALGAAAAVIAAAFVIAPVTGLASLHWVAIAVSVTTAAMLLRSTRRAREPRPGSQPASTTTAGPLPTTVSASGRLQVSRASRSQTAARHLPVTAGGRLAPWCLSGATLVVAAGALAAHCLWDRIGSQGAVTDARLSLLLLASAMAGFGLGALAGGRLVTSRLGLGASLVAVNLLAAVATVLIYLQARAWLAPIDPAAWLPLVWLGVYALPFVILAVTITIAIALGSTRAGDLPEIASRHLALVALGGMAGTAVAWLWVLPAGGFESLVKGVVVANVVVALLSMPFLDGRGRVATAIVAALVIVTTALLSLGRPEVMAVDLDDDVLAVSRPIERFHAVGRTHAVRVIEHQGRFVLQIDGEPRASVPVRGSPPTQDARQWLATLPITARPNARSVLALGLAGGVMLEGIPSSIAHVDVIETEPVVVAANRAIAAERIADPLERPQITIIRNDVRRALRLSAERYDIVVSQLAPGHGVAGGTTQSRQLFAELRDHLTDDGIVAQLVDRAALNSRAVRSMAATLEAEFAHVRLYRPEPGSLIFLASATPIEPELQLARSGAPITGDVMHYSRIGMNGVEDLLAALVADETGVQALAQTGSVRTDDTLGVDAGDLQPAMATLSDAVAGADPLRLRASWIYSNLADAANFAYLTRRLIAQNQRQRALAASEAHPDESIRLTMVGLLHAASGQAQQALAAYDRAVMERADNAEARYLLLEPNIAFLAQESPPAELQALADELPASAAAVIAARRAGAAQDWGTIADLDGSLGLASVTDAWYPDVVLLRAEWRSRVNRNVEQFAFDALRLVDRVVLIRPERNFFLLRAAIGIAIADGHLAVESSRRIVRLTAEMIQSATDDDGRIERRQVEIIRQNMEAITTSLRGELVADNERRAEEVRQAASLILRFFDAALVERPQ